MLVRADCVRFGLHPDGWAQLIDFGNSPVAVVDSHPWATQAGIRVVGDEDRLAEMAVESLVAVSEPVLDACRGMGKVGRAALWAEIADDFGLTALHQLQVVPDPALLARVRSALATAGAPWRITPEIRLVDHVGGPSCVGRKGGCCLAFQSTPGDADSASPPDPRLDAYRWRFPPEPQHLRYCSTCSLREFEDCADGRCSGWIESARRATLDPHTV